MRVIALDTHDGHFEGDQYEVPEHRARQLIAKGLVKAGPVPKNKMAPVCENKANPTPAVGEEATQLSSRAAQAFPETTANGYFRGVVEIPKRPRGRPRKNPPAV